MSYRTTNAGARRGLQAVVAGWLLVTSVFVSTAHAAAASYPSGWIDAPATDARLSGSSATVNGWALDAAATTGSGVDHVDMYVDGTYVSPAIYGDSRPDMAAAFGPQFQSSGYHATLDLTHLAGGSHTIEMRAHSVISGQLSSSTRNVSVIKRLEFGVNAHLMWYGLDQAISDLDRVQAAGLSTVRFDLYWSSIEPSLKGQYDQAYLTKLDGVIAAARTRGINSTIAVLGTPAWARANLGSIMTPPANPADYGDILGMLASRYASVPGVAYEIWNEPNQPQFWNVAGGPNAGGYTKLLLAAYPRIKSVAPSALVLGGSIAFNDQAFITGMYAAGAKGSFDVLALHPYSLGYAPSSTASGYESYTLALQNMHTTLVSMGEPNKPIWITESGWSTNDVSDATRAGYIQQAVSMLPSTFAYVESYQAYALNQAEDMPDMGLTSGTGVPTQTWTAYIASARAAVAARQS